VFLGHVSPIRQVVNSCGRIHAVRLPASGYAENIPVPRGYGYISRIIDSSRIATRKLVSQRTRKAPLKSAPKQRGTRRNLLYSIPIVSFLLSSRSDCARSNELVSSVAIGGTLDTNIDLISQEAADAFKKGEYQKVRNYCRQLVELDPTMVYAWSLLGTSELILGSRDLDMTRDLRPNEVELLNEAIKHFDKSTSLAKEKDAITINNKANALGLLGKWNDAIETFDLAFQVSLDTRMKDFEVIPMMNKALALFEIERDQEAENQLNLLLRRHADYEDIYAALAAIRWGRGRKLEAADSFDKLCDLDYGVCDAYSDVRIVLGRWPKRAIRAYRDFLVHYKDEKSQVSL